MISLAGTVLIQKAKYPEARVITDDGFNTLHIVLVVIPEQCANAWDFTIKVDKLGSAEVEGNLEQAELYRETCQQGLTMAKLIKYRN